MKNGMKKAKLHNAIAIATMTTIQPIKSERVFMNDKLLTISQVVCRMKTIIAMTNIPVSQFFIESSMSDIFIISPHQQNL